MSRLVKKIIIGLVWLLILSPAGFSSEEKKPDAEAEDPAFMELIEFIGSFETADGRWLDPLELEEMKELDSHLNDDPAETPKKENEGGS